MKSIDKQEFECIKNFISNLSRGIDPLSGIGLPDDTVLNNRKYLQVFSRLDEILYYFSKNTNRMCYSRKRKSEFYLSNSEILKIAISKDPISVSEIAYNINAIIDSSRMEKIKAIQITEWLMEKGYLQEDPEGNTSHKICTNKANEIGINTVIKRNSKNERYYVNLYNDIAQKFIIDNVNDI